MSENNNAARDQILSQLPRSDAKRPPIWDEAESGPDHLQIFADRFTALGGQIRELADLSEVGLVYVDGDLDIEVNEKTNDVWSCETGITRAEFGIAETGSVVVSSGPTHLRLASLAPPRHVVILRRSDIVPDLATAFARMPDRNVAIITGPSRTADIEGVLVRGVHGPREIWVVFVD